jgi:NitT/TauT family transport system permease protein
MRIRKPMSTPMRSRNFRRLLPWLTTPLLCGVIVAAWQLYVLNWDVSSFILPSPLSVGRAWIAMLHSERAWLHTWTTVYETLVGFLWGVVVGILLGVAIARSQWLESTLNPFVVGIQVVPKVAFVPLFVVWFGFGITSKVIVAAVLSCFPILTNTVLGIKSVDHGYKDVMISLNATRYQMFRRLELPSSLPYIITGMEVGVVLALIGAIVGEYMGGNDGLGYLMVARMNAFQTDQLFAVMIHMTLIGFATFFLVGLLRRVLVPWHQSAIPRAME